MQAVTPLALPFRLWGAGNVLAGQSAFEVEVEIMAGQFELAKQTEAAAKAAKATRVAGSDAVRPTHDPLPLTVSHPRKAFSNPYCKGACQ
jgi:hypothetical protein